RLEPRRRAPLRRVLGDLERVRKLLGVTLRRSEARRERLVETLVEGPDGVLHPLADAVERACDRAEARAGLGADRLPHRVDPADDVPLRVGRQELLRAVPERGD